MSDDFMRQEEYCAELGKTQVFSLIEKFLKTRPGSMGFDFADYGGSARDRASLEMARRSYFADYRPIRKALRIGRYLLLMAQGRDWEPANMAYALQHAYSGRLNLHKFSDDKIGLDYCTGQYTPTEYRMAVVSVLCYYLDLDFDRVWNTRNWLYGNAVR